MQIVLSLQQNIFGFSISGSRVSILTTARIMELRPLSRVHKHSNSTLSNLWWFYSSGDTSDSDGCSFVSLVTLVVGANRPKTFFVPIVPERPLSLSTSAFFREVFIVLLKLCCAWSCSVFISCIWLCRSWIYFFIESMTQKREGYKNPRSRHWLYPVAILSAIHFTRITEHKV